MQTRLSELEKENQLLKESVDWYRRTYENRKLAGIIKDRIWNIFRKPGQKVAGENEHPEIHTTIVDSSRAKQYMKKKGDLVQQRFYKSHSGNFTLKTPGQCNQFFKINFETLLPVDKNLFIAGWMVDPERTIEEVYFMFEDMSFSENILPYLLHFTRNDVRDHYLAQQMDVRHDSGFFGFIQNLHSLHESDRFVEIHVLTRQHELVIYKCELTHKNLGFINKIKLVLSVVDVNGGGLFDKYERCFGPVIQKISAAKPVPAMHRWEKTFGVPHRNPKVSIVIPLYGRYDFIQFQLSQFCNDPDLQDVEIIYVIDDPSIFNAIVMFSNQLFPIFHLPFRLVYCGNNLGFAGANNFGVSHAVAPYILLLNSDIIPKEKGWLTRLLDNYKKLPGCGILGPTLLYEDKSIQHAGMKFDQFHFLEGFWLNEHPGKGMPVWLADTGNKPKPMPAVTGACMLISKELYNQVGGFDESYILGDFEDSDLCLKIRKINLKCYYIPEVSLYHLERKSQSLFDDQNWKYKVTLYNGWLHTKRWGKLIESMNAQ